MTTFNWDVVQEAATEFGVDPYWLSGVLVREDTKANQLDDLAGRVDALVDQVNFLEAGVRIDERRINELTARHDAELKESAENTEYICSRLGEHDAELAELRDFVVKHEAQLTTHLEWFDNLKEGQSASDAIIYSDEVPAPRDDVDPFAGKRANSVREVVEDALSHRDDAAQDEAAKWEAVSNEWDRQRKDYRSAVLSDYDSKAPLFNRHTERLACLQAARDEMIRQGLVTAPEGESDVRRLVKAAGDLVDCRIIDTYGPLIDAKQQLRESLAPFLTPAADADGVKGKES